MKKLRLGPNGRTKCVCCNVRCDVRCRNIKKPMEPNIRGTRLLVGGRHNVMIFDGLSYARTDVESC
jgi:hypothetical protein